MHTSLRCLKITIWKNETWLKLQHLHMNDANEMSCVRGRERSTNERPEWSRSKYITAFLRMHSYRHRNHALNMHPNRIHSLPTTLTLHLQLECDLVATSSRLDMLAMKWQNSIPRNLETPPIAIDHLCFAVAGFHAKSDLRQLAENHNQFSLTWVEWKLHKFRKSLTGAQIINISGVLCSIGHMRL